MRANAPDENNADNKRVWIEKVINYVVSRQNDDGGYTFCQETESNLQDTFYGLAILELLHFPFPRVERTIHWLRDFDIDSIYSCYYVVKALRLCSKKPEKHLVDLVLSFIDEEKWSKVSTPFTDAYLGDTSEFIVAFMVTELSQILELGINGESTISWLLNFLNPDGGFGTGSSSNIVSTYHAVASLKNLGYDVRHLRDTSTFVRSCEKPSGGFAVIPRAPESYMEYTYFGVMCLDLLGKECKFPSRVADFVLECQNLNGGFGRSKLSISTFENTYQAICVLRKLNII